MILAACLYMLQPYCIHEINVDITHAILDLWKSTV